MPSQTVNEYMLEQISENDVNTLSRFLSDPKRPEGSLCFHELQGFLFAVASSPELIPPSEWQPIISNEENIEYRDETEVQQIIGLIMDLYNTVNAAVLERSDNLPIGCAFESEIEDNFDDELPITQWSRGFMIGHDWLAEVWDSYLPDEFDEELGSTAMVLSFFGSRRLAEMYYLESTTTPTRRKSNVPFEEFAEKVRALFPAALSSYAHIGRSISEALLARARSDA